MYPCITEAEVCDLEKKLGCAIPEVYRDFLMNVSNGFDIMNCTLALHGCRTSYDRSDLDSWYPFNIEDIQKYERPKNATPEMFFLGTYEYGRGPNMTRETLVKIERGIQHIIGTHLSGICDCLRTSYDELLK